MPYLILSWKYIHVFSYGFFLSLGLLAGGFSLFKELRHTSWDDDQVFSLTIKSVFWSFVASRLFYLYTYVQLGLVEFFNWYKHPGLSGLVFWLFFWLLSWYQARKKDFDAWQFLDFLMWAAFSFLIFSSLACFNGACFVGQQFAYGLPVIGYAGNRHMLSLYHLILSLAITGVFSRMRFKFKSFSWYKNEKSGFVFWLGGGSYSLLRAIFIESLKQPSLPVLGLNLSFWLWLVAGLAFLTVFVFWSGSVNIYLLFKSIKSDLKFPVVYKVKKTKRRQR